MDETTLLQEGTKLKAQQEETADISMGKMEEPILQERKKLIVQLKETIGHWNRSSPLNIVFVGTPGCGKSSFINSFAASISDDKYREYACSGSRGPGVAHQNTVRIQSFESTNYGTFSSIKECPLPTLTDLTGILGGDVEITKEILRLIFYGKLRNTSNLNSVFRFGKAFGVWALRLWYGVLYHENHLKVDRVVVVASANEEVPDGLFNTVLEVARPNDDVCNREIPVFGVMTGIDIVDESQTEVYEERKTKFINSLALVGASHKYLQCVNYCDEVDPTRKRMSQTLPHIDVPILKFMNVVCGRNYGVVNSEESYRDVLRGQLRHKIRSLVVNLWKHVHKIRSLVVNLWKNVQATFTRGQLRQVNPTGVDIAVLLFCAVVCCFVFVMIRKLFQQW